MKKDIRSIRVWICIFIVALVLSGLTAFAVETELRWLLSVWPWRANALHDWLLAAYQGLSATNAAFPAMAYGYDWLAFAHLVIAVAFIGPWKDPVRNIWVIQFGCIACVMIFPLAFIAGPVRQIPFFWQLLDCSFGIIGLVPLWIVYRKIKKLESRMNNEPSTQIYYTPL